jgi:triphosphoribosyl-dephospho-CoA synthase
MLRATGGVNTHRGAIFALGLLAAAAGRLAREGRPCRGAALGDVVREGWGAELRRLAPAPASHGAAAARAHGVAGAREEAARGFPHVFEVALPALEASLARGAGPEAARVQCLLALVARLPDTNLLHRGGADGLALARGAARAFLRAGGVHRPGWRARAEGMHRALVARNLSPGGSADLLAAALFVRRLGGGAAPARAGGVRPEARGAAV